MRVLWISKTPCGANKIINPNEVLAGWVATLEKALIEEPEIELHECYLCNKDIKNFVYNGVYNYPIFDSFYSSKKYFIISQLAILTNHLVSDKRIQRMKDVIRSVNPDIIHIHGSESELGIIVKQITDIPIVISLQGIIAPIENKQYSGIPYSEVSKHDSIGKFIAFRSSQYGLKAWRLYKSREKEILKNTNYLIGRTDWDRRVASILAPQAKYYYGGEILRKPFYESTPWGKDAFGSPFTIVSIITNGLFKGFETVLRSAELLKCIGFKFRWVIIGQSSNSHIISMFEKYTHIKSKNVNVELIGKKNAEELVEIFKSSDLYCQVSHIENSPNSVCEAMLLGLPVIATMAGGTASIIEHEKTGILFQEGEYYSLAGLIIESSKNFGHMKDLATAARSAAIIRHDVKKIAKQYITAYQSIINTSV